MPYIFIPHRTPKVKVFLRFFVPENAKKGGSCSTLFLGKKVPPDRIAQLNNLLQKSRWVPPLLFHAPFLQQPVKAVPGGLQSAGGARAPFQSSVGLYVRSPRIGQEKFNSI